MSGFIKSSIARKVAMALSGLFLVIFLLQHLFINSFTVFSEDTFNRYSHFMGTDDLVQFVLQPILIIGVLFHFIMGIFLEVNNSKARPVSNKKFSGSANSSWMSRNMLFTGLVILAFLALHFYDFWFPEIVHKYVYIQDHPLDTTRYYRETIEKFHNPWRTGLYVFSFVFLALHLLHGFSSSFQSIGFNNKYSKSFKGFTIAFSILVPLGFMFIALYHYFNQ